MSRSILVNVDPDICTKLLSYAAELLSDRSSAQSLLAEGEAAQRRADTSAVVELLLAQAQAVFAADNAADVEGYFQGVVFVIQHYLSEEQSLQPIKRVREVVVAANANAAVKFNILVTIFNICKSNKSKFDIIIALFSVAKSSDQSMSVLKFHQYVDSWVTQWQLSVQEVRSLYLATVDMIKAAKVSSSSSTAVITSSTGELSLRYSISYLQTFNDVACTAAEEATYAAFAISTIVEALVTCGPGASTAPSTIAAIYQRRNELYAVS
jgi:hypothetical protein